MSIKHLYEDERPTLLLDFANSKTLDPRFTFTRNSAATYVDEQGIIKTAAAGEERFDHDSATGECLGLLIEEDRTNLIANSQVFATGYSVGNLTITDNVAVAPDGTTTAASMIETANTDGHSIQLSSTSQSEFSQSIFVKPNGRDNICVRFVTNSNDWYTFTFNLTGDGSITQEQASSSSTWTIRYRSITALANGWYRIAVSAIGTATPYIFSVLGCDSSTPTLVAQWGFPRYTGDITKGYYVWGAQVETDPFPTSYIPTSGSTVTRAAEVYNFNDSNVFGSSSGTFIVDATVFARIGDNLNNKYIFIASAATGNTSVSITAGPGYSFQVYDSVYTGLVNYGAYTSGVRVTTAGAYAPGPSGSSSADVAFASDGAIRGTNTATGGSATPAGMYQMYLFRFNSGVASSLATGYLHKLAFYPTRLSNSTLEELTK